MAARGSSGMGTRQSKRWGWGVGTDGGGAGWGGEWGRDREGVWNWGGMGKQPLRM